MSILVYIRIYACIQIRINARMQALINVCVYADVPNFIYSNEVWYISIYTKSYIHMTLYICIKIDFDRILKLFRPISRTR